MVSARRNHVMALNPFMAPGLIVCGGYSYRRKKWFFMHEWNEAKNGFDSVCEVWDGRAKRFTAIGNRIKLNLHESEKESFSRAQALSATITWESNALLILSGDVDDEGIDDIFLLDKPGKSMTATNIGSLAEGIPGWKTWRGRNTEGEPNMGAKSGC